MFNVNQYFYPILRQIPYNSFFLLLSQLTTILIYFNSTVKTFRPSCLYVVNIHSYMPTYLRSLFSFLRFLTSVWNHFPSTRSRLLEFLLKWSCFLPLSRKIFFSQYETQSCKLFSVSSLSFLFHIFWLSLLETVLEIGSINTYHLVNIFMLLKCYFFRNSC